MDKLSDSSDHFSENLIVFSACDKTEEWDISTNKLIEEAIGSD